MSFSKLACRLLEHAGYDPANLKGERGGAFQAEYTGLLHTLGYIGARKVDQYGDFRLTDIRSFERETWGAYWDIQRKFGRLETQMEQARGSRQFFVDSSGLTGAVGDMQETLSDMAVYCVRMIQVLQRLEEKGMEPK